MTLRTKTMLILVVTVTGSIGGCGLFFLHYFENSFRASVFQTVDSFARVNADSLSEYLKRQHKVVKHLGMMLPIDALGLRKYSWIESYLADHGQEFNMFENGIFFLDNEGVLRIDHPAHPEVRGKDFSFRPYFQQTMAARRSVLSRPYRSARTGEIVLTLTAPLADKDDRPLGMLGGSLRLFDDTELARIRTQKIGATGYSYVFDKSRLMILHPDEQRMLKRDISVGVNKMFDAATAGFEGTGETVNSKGVKMFAAFRQVPGTDWIVAAQQPAEEALQPLVRSRRSLMLFMIGGSILAALTGMIMVHRSMRGLVQLERVTAELAIPDENSDHREGDFRAETEKLRQLTKHAEFGSLARTISELYTRLGKVLIVSSRMSDSLEAAFQQLKSSQAQILQQEKMASIGQLAAGVAHEINNPMGFITSNLNSLGRYQEKLTAHLQLLEGWFFDAADKDLQERFAVEKKKQKVSYILEDIQDLLSESAEGVERVREIVQNLKSFSRVDQAALSEADINECLESTLAIAWNEIKYKARVEKGFSELPLLPCYPQQLNQVFLNILVNAAQAIDENGVIKIATWQEDDQIKISISDNGSGIPETIRSRIFEPFFTTKEVGQGTGLGMSISYEIIQQHQGDIWVDSTEGRGTTFFIALPLEREGDR